MTDYPDDYFGDHVHQATAMIAAQANCTMGEALDRLRIRAAAMDQSLEHTALDVLDGQIRFGPL
jgi:hypothetical protein